MKYFIAAGSAVFLGKAVFGDPSWDVFTHRQITGIVGIMLGYMYLEDLFCMVANAIKEKK